jgi:transcriptional regulator with XRE-family HTH domain
VFDWPVLLRAFRREQSMTQEALSELLEVSPKTISRWERGVDRPSLAKEAQLRRVMAADRGGVDAALLRAFESSTGVVVMIDDQMRGLASSVGHANFYEYKTNTYIGQDIERSIPENAFEIFRSCGGPRRLLTHSLGFSLVLHREADQINRTGLSQCIHYITAPLVLDDGRRIWLSTGARAAPGSNQVLVVY